MKFDYKNKLILFTPIFCLIIYLILFILFELNIQVFFIGLGFIFIYMLFVFAYIYTYDNEKKIKEDENIKKNKELIKINKELIGKRNDLEQYFLLWTHQIKTPITAGYLILDDFENYNINDLRFQLLKIENYTSMAINYIKVNNSDKDMEFINTNLNDIISPLLKKYSIEFISKNIKLNYKTIDKCIITDRKLLSIIIEQLLSNALKYTDSGEISIYYKEDSKSIFIKDTGRGIPKENINKIFDKGYSGFNGSLNQKSSGIGLYLASTIAKRLNYKIMVKSILGKGSEFQILI